MTAADVLQALDALPRDAIPAAIVRLAARLLSEAPAPTVAREPAGRMLTPDEAAARLGVARRWIYRHARELGAVALSKRKVRVPEAAVERLLTKKRPRPPT